MYSQAHQVTIIDTRDYTTGDSIRIRLITLALLPTWEVELCSLLNGLRLLARVKACETMQMVPVTQAVITEY